ncbi:unnamed protein product [Trichogramma brassicae]|uniref:Ionotropic glutamate receptor C-terminal domain-containing protein n=1 Tax=Trichogramma brassicae TaxID=86971 RepID=A0A6H5J074_9HYME|nr:unnamed protein product [Trichogramma brassicae]
MNASASVFHLYIILSNSIFMSLPIIFHKGDDELEQAFDEALQDLENEQNHYFKLKPIKKIVCELMQEGIAAIFGPKFHLTREIVSNIVSQFDVPHIEFSYRSRETDEAPHPSINVYPGRIEFQKAIAEVVKQMTWQSYTYIYQTVDTISRIHDTLALRGRGDYPITIRELPPLHSIKKMTEKEITYTYESLVKKIQVSSQSSLLIDIESENLGTLLNTMNKMGVMSDYFMSFIVNLDSSLEDMNLYISKSSVANITQFKFIQDESKKISVEAALLYDSVFAFNDALINLYQDMSFSKRNVDLRPKSLSCYGKNKYKFGQNITSYFLKKTRLGRKTGLMTFNEIGDREFEFDILNVQAGRKTTVGQWKNGELVLHRNEKEINDTLSEAAKSKIFRVTTRVGRVIGDRKFEGYCIDLIAKIEEFLGIRCEFQIVPDGNYGSLNPQTKQWNGLIKQLLEHKADLAICDLTITSERQSAVDFTAPFLNLGISIIFSKPEKVVPELFSFMSPLSIEVWMYMATAYLIVSLMLFLQARIAPGEWVNPHPCNPDPEELENNFTLMNSFWLTMGSLMQQGSDVLPRTPSIRMLTGMWYFFVLIMVSSYTANLAAFLTAVKMEDSINDVEDLAKQTKISYGALKDGSTYSFFKNSNTSLYQRIFNTMADAKPSVFTKTNDEGVDRVIKGKRKYAFFMESTSIEYQIERHCELQMVGNLLDNKGYGIAMPPNSPYRTMISTAILHLQEKGELQQLKQKWWKDMGGGKCDDASDEPANSNELGMPHVGGVFLVLMFGALISFGIAIAEFLWNVRKVAVDEKLTPWEAFVAEFKFVINIKAITKPVRTEKSSSKSTSFQTTELNRLDHMHESNPSSIHTLAMNERTNNLHNNRQHSSDS